MIDINKQNYTEHLNKKEGVIYSLHDDLLSVFNIDFFSKIAAITVRKSYPQRAVFGAKTMRFTQWI